jgi:hypothetical protein
MYMKMKGKRREETGKVKEGLEEDGGSGEY